MSLSIENPFFAIKNHSRIAERARRKKKKSSFQKNPPPSGDMQLQKVPLKVEWMVCIVLLTCSIIFRMLKKWECAWDVNEFDGGKDGRKAWMVKMHSFETQMAFALERNFLGDLNELKMKTDEKIISILKAEKSCEVFKYDFWLKEQHSRASHFKSKDHQFFGWTHFRW